MVRKEYRLADLSPDQFFLQATGNETAAFVGKHGSEIDGLAIGLDDDAGISVRAPVAIAPTFIFDANVFDFGRGEPPAKPERANAGEGDTLTPLYLYFCAPTQAA